MNTSAFIRQDLQNLQDGIKEAEVILRIYKFAAQTAPLRSAKRRRAPAAEQEEQVQTHLCFLCDFVA
jgi:hypothetical protein